MATMNMRYKLTFPGLSELSDYQKSLIGFFLDHSAVFINDLGFEETFNLEVSTIVRDKYFVKPKNWDSDCHPWLLTIRPTEEGDYYYNDLKNGLFEWPHAHSLVKSNALLAAFTYSQSSSYEDQGVANFVNVVDLNIPVTLTPMVNDEEYTGKALPADIVSETQKVVMVDIDKEDVGFNYDYQVRSSSFTIKLYNEETEEYDYRDVFYKIGIFPFVNGVKTIYNDEEITVNQCSMEDAISQLLNKRIYLRDISWCSGGDFEFGIVTSTDSFYDNDGLVVDTHFVTDDPGHHLIWDHMIASLDGSPSSPVLSIGVLYIKLFNQDGTPISSPLGGIIEMGQEDIDNTFELTYRLSEEASPEESVGGLKLTLTENSLEGGFVSGTTVG